ncbi:hypothetical protein CR513_57717 [Mucuna pruriens]|uniref:Uncharacterized protein n=1 Tax=Mucuna pruriens TaxID=157652 RepID=A0A371ECS5_MUCPR|nr:hypothetical protein CR513_57717 [Mucuna pruriens]
MPSGAKKRKAARKKKEKERNINPSTNNPQGNVDLKSQDEKGSDGGESNSPAFHEHVDDHHHPFTDGSGELEERDPSAAQLRASDSESLEEVPSDVKIDQVLGGKEDSVVLVERGLESEESSESKNVSFEHTETAKELYYENRNGGDTSKGESLTEKNSEDGNCNSVEEAIASHELVKSIDSKMTSITEMAQVEETVNLGADSSVNSVKAMASVSEVEKSDTESVLLEKSVVHPVEVTNLVVKINEDDVYPLINENVTTSSMEKPKPKEYDSKVLASLSASPFTKITNGAEHIKDSKTAERSENQPCVALAPNVVQKTSWLSCCGLFEVVSSSNR